MAVTRKFNSGAFLSGETLSQLSNPSVPNSRNFQSSFASNRDRINSSNPANTFTYPFGFSATVNPGGSAGGIYGGIYTIQDLLLQFSVPLGTYSIHGIGNGDGGPPQLPTPAYASAINVPYIKPETQPTNGIITTLSGPDMTPQPVMLGAFFRVPDRGWGQNQTYFDAVATNGQAQKQLNNNGLYVGYYCFDNVGTDAQTQWSDLIIPGTYNLAIGGLYIVEGSAGVNVGFSNLVTCRFQFYATSPLAVSPILLAETSDGVNFTLGPLFVSLINNPPNGTFQGNGQLLKFDSIAAFGPSSPWQMLIVQRGMKIDFSRLTWLEQMADVTITSGTGPRPKGQSWANTVDYVPGIDVNADAFIHANHIIASHVVSTSVTASSIGADEFGTGGEDYQSAGGWIRGTRVGP